MGSFCFWRRPFCVDFFMVRLLPHSGHVGEVIAVRLYLHFLQCLCVEMRLPIRPLMRRASAMMIAVEKMMMKSVWVCGMLESRKWD